MPIFLLPLFFSNIGEFERAAKAFGDKPIPVPVSRGTGSSGGDSARGALPRRARFIRWYSLYLAGERRREVNIAVSNYVYVCVCVCVFIELHITAQSGPANLVILCHSH